MMKCMGDLAYTAMLISLFLLIALTVRCLNRDRNPKA